MPLLERLIGIAAIDQAASIGERVGQVTNGAPPRLALYLPRLTGKRTRICKMGLHQSEKPAQRVPAGVVGLYI